jgi:hypothetical protein
MVVVSKVVVVTGGGNAIGIVEVPRESIQTCTRFTSRQRTDCWRSRQLTAAVAGSYFAGKPWLQKSIEGKGDRFIFLI